MDYIVKSEFCTLDCCCIPLYMRPDREFLPCLSCRFFQPELFDVPTLICDEEDFNG